MVTGRLEELADIFVGDCEGPDILGMIVGVLVGFPSPLYWILGCNLVSSKSSSSLSFLKKLYVFCVTSIKIPVQVRSLSQILGDGFTALFPLHPHPSALHGCIFGPGLRLDVVRRV
jgi:hypothetical protein